MKVVHAAVNFRYSAQELVWTVEAVCSVYWVIAEVCLRDVIVHVLQAPLYGLQKGRMAEQLMHVLRAIHCCCDQDADPCIWNDHMAGGLCR
jgi:hypothetical protein